MMKQTQIPSEMINRIALLAGLAFLLSAVEYTIPKPLPFIRLGLANFPILIALSCFSPTQVLLLILLKILGQGLIQGTLFSYTFLLSSSGSISAGLVMIFLFKTGGKRITLIGVSLAGALVSNLIQIYLAGILIAGAAVALIGPPFLIIGLISSAVLGYLAQRFIGSSQWVQRIRQGRETRE